MQDTRVQSLGLNDPLAEEMAAHSSILAREIHRQRSLAGSVHGLQSQMQLSVHTHTEVSDSHQELF